MSIEVTTDNSAEQHQLSSTAPRAPTTLQRGSTWQDSEPPKRPSVAHPPQTAQFSSRQVRCACSVCFLQPFMSYYKPSKGVSSKLEAEQAPATCHKCSPRRAPTDLQSACHHHSVSVLTEGCVCWVGCSAPTRHSRLVSPPVNKHLLLPCSRDVHAAAGPCKHHQPHLWFNPST